MAIYANFMVEGEHPRSRMGRYKSYRLALGISILLEKTAEVGCDNTLSRFGGSIVHARDLREDDTTRLGLSERTPETARREKRRGYKTANTPEQETGSYTPPY